MGQQAKGPILDGEEAAESGIVRASADLVCVFEEAGGGPAGSARIAAFRWGAIVSDVNVPGMAGLAIRRQTVRARQGTIEVYSRPGQGSASLVKLPPGLSG